MCEILNKFSNLKKFSEILRHQICMFYVFDDYMGKNYLYLTADDQCYAFGFNLYGCLGFGHNMSVEEPQYVPELSKKNIIDFFKGFNFMFGRTSDNEIYCWGQNESGQLGLGYKSFEEDFIKPERNQYLSAKNIVNISCGFKHVIALTLDGKVFGWGDNSRGQVGCGLNHNIINKPVNLSSISSELAIKSITCGAYHSMVLTVDNFLFSWGDNKYGQLATGDYESSKLPKLVLNLDISVSKIVGSKSSTYLLTKEGKIYYCGENYILGVEGKTCKPTELTTNLNKHFIDISSGYPYYYCLAKTDESVYELMKNELKLFESNYTNFDQYFIQNFHTTYRTMNLKERTLDSSQLLIENCLIDHLNLFPHHLKNIIKIFYVFDDIDGKNCVYVTEDNKVYAFGSNYSGILGIGVVGDIEEPVLIKELSGQIIEQFYSGKGFMFAKSADNDIFCWGNNVLAQLGLGYVSQYSKPVKNNLLNGLNIVDIVCGQNHTLALSQNGDIYGWGDNQWGQVGCGSSAKIISVPTRIEIFLKVKAVACGDYHCLALTHGRSVLSWGKNKYGQLGQFWFDKINAPSNIIDNNIVSIACNHENSYLLSRDGTLSVHGQIVCQFNVATSQNFVKLPGTSPDIGLCARNNGSMISLLNKSVYELRRQEIPLIKMNYFSYNQYLTDNLNVTHRPVHLISYEKMMLMGEGSFGLVYKCQNKQTKELFALRVLNKGLNIQESGKIYNELKKFKQISSNCLVNLEDIWIENNKTICLKTQFYDFNLIDLMMAKVMAFNRKLFDPICSVEFYITLAIYRQIVDGTNYLHCLKPPIIHRNLKTANIFIAKNSQINNLIKISNFGFSKFTDWGLSLENESQNKFKYSINDVIKGKKFGFKTDIFCLANICEELFEIGMFSVTSMEKSTKDYKMNQIIKLVKSMQSINHWSLRPSCRDVLATIDELYPTSVELTTTSEFKNIFDSLKNCKINLFYEIVKSLLNKTK